LLFRYSGIAFAPPCTKRHDLNRSLTHTRTHTHTHTHTLMLLAKFFSISIPVTIFRRPSANGGQQLRHYPGRLKLRTPLILGSSGHNGGMDVLLSYLHARQLRKPGIVWRKLYTPKRCVDNLVGLRR